MSDNEVKDTSEEIQKLLGTICTHFDVEDRAVRERQIRLWKRLKYLWDGIERVWWSEVAHDWRVWDLNNVESNQAGDQSSFYDKPVNVYRAYLESIIAALSVVVPPVTCYPDDADNPLDIETAKAGEKIAELIFKHNDAPLLWLHALFIYCTEGMIAAYNYTKEDISFGLYTEDETEDVEEDQSNAFCPNCGTKLDPAVIARERDEFNPGPEDVELHDMLAQGINLCPQCMAQVDPEIRTEKVIVTRIVGTTTKPKSRQCIEVIGGLFVKIPVYARNQSECPYLRYSYETHFSNIIEKYGHLRNYLLKKERPTTSSAGMYDPYERWGRISTQYLGEYPLNTPTVNMYWLRPSSYNVLSEDEDVKKLKKLYPDGCCVTFINEMFAEAYNANLDDSWTLSYNPLADYLHHDPLGMLLTSVQEISNEIISLTLQTIEHGIPQTFADPAVLNFKAYEQTEASPGQIYPAKAQAGKSVGDGFYEVKTATLSAEVLPFAEKIQELGQLVSGALPSLFGGPAPGSKTAAQYSMSRAQAMQRLQTPWKMLTLWWKNIFGKVIPAYIKSVADDERIVEKDEQGNFINTYIRKAQLLGKIGSIELESDEQLPLTWSQKKDVIMQLMQAGNPLVMQNLSSPENAPLVRDAIGLRDFNIMGQGDRDLQYQEIRDLLASSSYPDGEGGITPSVEIEPLIDNHPIHIEICRNWAISAAGRLSKLENEPGYKNVLLHMQQHILIMQQMSGMQQGNPQDSQQDNTQEDTNNKPTPAAAQLPRSSNAVQ